MATDEIANQGYFFTKLATLTRENVMKQATSMNNVHAKSLLPGILMNTSATNYAPIQQMRRIKLNGERWQIVGDVINVGDKKSPRRLIGSSVRQPAVDRQAVSKRRPKSIYMM